MPSSTLVASLILAPALAMAQQVIRPGASAQRCIQPKHASMIDGTPVVLAPCAAGASEQTFFFENGLVRVFSNQCITVPGGAANGDALQIATCNGDDAAQQWSFDEANKALVNAGSKGCMDLSHGDLSVGAQISIWSCGPGAANQVWSIENVDGAPAEPAPAPTGEPAPGEPVPTSEPAPGEPVPTEAPAPGEPVPTGEPTPGEPVPTEAPAPGEPAPTGEPAPGEPAPTGEPAPVPTEPAPAPQGNQVKPEKNQNMCLTASDNTDGAPVVISTCTGDASQAWEIRGSQLTIHGDKCLDVTEGRNEKGTKLQIWTCVDGGSNQLFKVWKNNHIAWLNFDKCVDVTDGVYRDGNPIQLWQCSTTTQNQNWVLA
ncbi:hypothetical protein AURDEDRAFT_110139 [Auricularia subglabra TFB-10046 SS5]|nr:hypothetical protein AURDEDRAFT_110139 [Auricularia subglabra TFB-10046 SS5]